MFALAAMASLPLIAFPVPDLDPRGQRVSATICAGTIGKLPIPQQKCLVASDPENEATVVLPQVNCAIRFTSSMDASEMVAIIGQWNPYKPCAFKPTLKPADIVEIGHIRINYGCAAGEKNFLLCIAPSKRVVPLVEPWVND